MDTHTQTVLEASFKLGEKMVSASPGGQFESSPSAEVDCPGGAVRDEEKTGRSWLEVGESCDVGSPDSWLLAGAPMCNEVLPFRMV